MVHGNTSTRAGGATPLVGAALLAVLVALNAEAQEPASGVAATARTAAPVPAAPPAPPAGRGFKELRDVQAPPNAKFEVPRMMRSGQITDQEMFDAWWRFRLSELTLSENGPKLSVLRKDLVRDWKQGLQAPTNPAHQRAVGFLLQGASAIANDQAFSPAARISVVLLIGELNKSESLFGRGPSEPLPDAHAELMRIVQDDNVSDIQDALRAAALVGLQRHAENTIPAAAKQEISDAMKKLAASDQPPAGRGTAVHAWLTARARGILSSLGVDVSVRAEAAQ